MEIVITIKIEDCEPVKVDVVYPKAETVEEFSQYARFFDETSLAWSSDSEVNLIFLKQQENYANERLKQKGYLFLNDVYDMLCIPRSKIGQVVGWIYDSTNLTDGKIVDFGLAKGHNSNFVNGYERSVLLDFNVYGNILNKMK